MKDILALILAFISITLAPALLAALFVYAAKGQALSLEMILRIIAGTSIVTIILLIFTLMETDQ